MSKIVGRIEFGRELQHGDLAVEVEQCASGGNSSQSLSTSFGVERNHCRDRRIRSIFAEDFHPSRSQRRRNDGRRRNIGERHRRFGHVEHEIDVHRLFSFFIQTFHHQSAFDQIAERIEKETGAGKRLCRMAGTERIVSKVRFVRHARPSLPEKRASKSFSMPK